MQVRVKTSPYKLNSYCSHLVEHCVFSGYSNEKSFFEIDCESNGTSWLGYTKFYIPDYKNIQNFIIHITKPLDTTIIAKEKKNIKEEVLESGKSTGSILMNKIGKIFYGKKFKRYARSSSITNTEIKEFHKIYYNIDNIRIIDNDFNIINRPKLIQKTNKQKTSQQSQIDIQAEGKKFTAYIFDYTTIYDYSLCYFLEWLYDTSSTYIYRYKGDSYYPPTSHFFEFMDKLAFIRRKNISIKITNDFFMKAKEMFLKNPINSSEIAAVNEILLGEITYTKEIKEIVSGFEYDMIKKFLEN